MVIRQVTSCLVLSMPTEALQWATNLRRNLGNRCKFVLLTIYAHAHITGKSERVEMLSLMRTHSENKNKVKSKPPESL